MTYRVVYRWAAVVALMIVPGFLAGCSGGEAAGPLQTLTLDGQPTVDGAGLEINPGAPAVFTAFVFNPLSTPVTLISASAVPVTGVRPTGELVHVAVATTHNMIAAVQGWPQPQFPVRQLRGARISHGQTNIIFAVTGRVPGTNYSVAGLRIRYRYQGQVFSVVAWSAAVACVAKTITRKRACPDIASQTQAKVEKMAA